MPRVRLEFFKSCWQREKKRERDEGEEGDEDSVWSDPFKCFARQQGDDLKQFPWKCCGLETKLFFSFFLFFSFRFQICLRGQMQS